MENLKIYLLSVHPACSCYVERTETGEIVKPDLNQCLVVQRMHHEAVKEAVERLEKITKANIPYHLRHKMSLRGATKSSV